MSAFCEHITEGRWRCRFPMGHDGEHGQHINVMRGAEQAAPALAVDPASGTRADSWSIPPASAPALTPPIPVAANPHEDETDAR